MTFKVTLLHYLLNLFPFVVFIATEVIFLFPPKRFFFVAVPVIATGTHLRHPAPLTHL